MGGQGVPPRGQFNDPVESDGFHQSSFYLPLRGDTEREVNF